MKVVYKTQFELMVKLLEIALQDDRVALKGGTAINLFYFDLPRYSVDIDLQYLPIEDRLTTYKNIHEILKKIKTDIQKSFNLVVTPSHNFEVFQPVKLTAFEPTRQEASVKIEPNYILRGGLFKPERRRICKSARENFNIDIQVQCLSFADVFAGKICAALSRQHPRDLFDIKMFLNNKGRLTQDIKDAFLLYLLSSGRPVYALLRPAPKKIEADYENRFNGMQVAKEISFSDLIDAQTWLLKEIIDVLDDRDREFIKSFVNGTPDWSLVRDAKIQNFPALRWRQYNQKKLGRDQLQSLVLALKWGPYDEKQS